jgi:hypothetical protein
MIMQPESSTGVLEAGGDAGDREPEEGLELATFLRARGTSAQPSERVNLELGQDVDVGSPEVDAPPQSSAA